MSSLARWSYKSVLTIWPPGTTDEFGQPTAGTPYTIMGRWAEGGDTVTDANGTQFVAMSRYFFEMAADDPLLPHREGYILRGDHTDKIDPFTAGAEKIRKVEGSDRTMFGQDEIPDWVVST